MPRLRRLSARRVDSLLRAATTAAGAIRLDLPTVRSHSRAVCKPVWVYACVRGGYQDCDWGWGEMKSHWQYLRYVLRHKWFVFLACLKLRVPLWQAIIHDWQKFTPAEWTPYALSFWGPWEYKNRPQWLVDAFDRAWLHHQHYGPHHWQYWLLREDSGGTKALEMPERYAREMVADWVGAGRAITGKVNLHEWYMQNKEKIVLHPRTRALVAALMFTHYGLPKVEDWPAHPPAGQEAQ